MPVGGRACPLIVSVFTFTALGVVDETRFDKVYCLTSWTVHRTPPVCGLFFGNEHTVSIRGSQEKDWKSFS